MMNLFQKFGQVYITTTYPQVVKAWHYHKVQTDHIVAVQGMIKLVLYDPREDSPTKGEINEFFIGVHHPLLVQVPQGSTTDGNASARRKRSSSTFRRKSIATVRRMSTAFLPMARISPMIGRERMDRKTTA